MIKKKVLALILAAATALTVFPAALAADETTETEPTQKKRVLLYKEDFEEANPEIYIFGNYNSTKTAASGNQFRTVADGENKAGAFYITGQTDVYQRVGYEFSEDGITSGEMDVKFRFKQGSGSNITWSHVLFGDNNKKGSLMQLLCYDKYQSETKPGSIKILDDNTKKFQNSIDAAKWYKYETKLDLSNQKMTATLKNDDDSVINTFADIAVSEHNAKKEFQNWPVDGSNTKFKMFGVSIDMVVDDIEIYCDPIEVTDFKLLRNDGVEYTSDASFLTARRGQLTFNHNAALIAEGAVKIGEQALTGELSADGKIYTFAIPSNLIGGKEHTITVDQSKIKMKAVQTSVDTGDNLYGEGTKAYTFTPSGLIDFSEDFDGNTVDFFAKANNGTSTKVEDTAKYEQKADTEGGNKYGHFCNTFIEENNVTGSETEKYYTTDWNRRALDFDKNGVTDGKLKVHFRFRPTAQTFEVKEDVKTNADGTNTGTVSGFGSVLIGNSDQMGADGIGHISGKIDARGNWISLINVKNGKLQTLNVDGGAAATPLKDAEDADAEVTQNTWYTCDAILDLDAHALNIRVIEDGTNKVFKASYSDLTARTSEWGKNLAVWPTATQPCIKSFGVLAAMDIDDIKITTDCSPSLTTTQTAATAKAATARQTNYMIIVQYDANDRIAAVEDKTFTLEAGQASVYSQDVNWADGAIRAKAFIWDNLNDANPLEKCAEIVRPVEEQAEGTE